MATLDLHPTWESRLTEKEKDKLLKLASSLTIIPNTLSTFLVRKKYKKNGGLITTVLLGNGYDKPLEVNQVKVKVCSKGEVIANEIFEPDLLIASQTLQAWSFVFKHESVRKSNDASEEWRVSVQLIEDE